MDDIAGLLHEYLLVAKNVEESEKESAREELKTTFESLQNLMLDEDIWKLFLDEQYDIADIKSRLNVKDDEERCQIFKVALRLPPPRDALKRHAFNVAVRDVLFNYVHTSQLHWTPSLREGGELP